MKSKTVYFLITLILTSILISCGKQDAPENLIEEAKMVDILTEVQLAESEVSRLSLQSYDSAVVAFEYLKAEILEKYNVDSLAYINSYEYYGQHPREFSLIFQDVEAKLKEMESEESEKEIEQQETERPTYQ